MKATEFRKLNKQELEKKINDLKKELFELRFKYATGQLENTNIIKETKRDIARAKTVYTEIQNQKEESEE